MAAETKCCTFYKFGFCKFGMQCRRVHYSEICEHKFCENVKFCEKRHPRSCYYFCAYGFCKFGNDCKFKHETPPSRNHASKDSEIKLKEENKALKKELVEINDNHEKLKVQLDNLMESQSKQEESSKNLVAKEIEKFKAEFVQILNDKNDIIDSQAKKIAELSMENQHLKIEKLNMKHNRLYACDICDFETEEKQHLTSHRQSDHENESESEDSDDDVYPTYQCDLCHYSAMYPDNVAFHYREVHNIKMSWEEAEAQCKR